MGAPIGNQFWKARTKHGRNKIFSSSEVLWESCIEYFEWVTANPLYEVKPFAYQGEITYAEIPKMRAMTITALCLFLDIDEMTWRRWKTDNDFCGIVLQAEKVIYSQKFEGAAAELLNSNIIARELGLKETIDANVFDGGDANLTPDERAKLAREKMLKDLE